MKYMPKLPKRKPPPKGDMALPKEFNLPRPLRAENHPRMADMLAYRAIPSRGGK